MQSSLHLVVQKPPGARSSEWVSMGRKLHSMGKIWTGGLKTFGDREWWNSMCTAEGVRMHVENRGRDGNRVTEGKRWC